MNNKHDNTSIGFKLHEYAGIKALMNMHKDSIENIKLEYYST